MPAQGKTKLSARGRGHDPNQNNPGKLQLMFGISQKAGQQQNRLTRQRQARAFQQQQRRHGPVAIVHQRAPQQLKNVVGHHLRLSSRIVYHPERVVLRANEGSELRFVILSETLFVSRRIRASRAPPRSLP